MVLASSCSRLARLTMPIAQLGDPMPGQRGNALEMLHPHMEKNGWTFHGWIADLEEAAKNKADADALRQDNAKLTADLSQWKGAVGKWQKAHDDLKRQLALSQGIRMAAQTRAAHSSRPCRAGARPNRLARLSTLGLAGRSR